MDNINESNDVGQLIREMETNFISGGGTLTSRYVTNDLYDDINKIYAYLESKHWTGETDSLGREKPFFNIVIAARNVWYRATDIDRKNVQVKPTKTKDAIPSFLATVHLQNWMRRENFGAFLNDWGIDLAAFNSSVVKFIESQGSLHPMVVPWSRIIVDQVDFDSNPKIELLELTEAQLYQRVNTHGYDKEIVDKLCEALTTRELTDRQKQDQKNNYIKLYELHGNLPLSYLTGNDKDQDSYEQQMHVISYVASKEKGKFDDFTLASGRESQDPYMLTSLLPNTDGSVSLNGAVKNLFEAQWMMNHTVKSVKDALDLASKQIFQTSDPQYVGRNVLTSLEVGDIMVHKENQPLTQINNQALNISAQQTFGSMWKGQASEINGISDSMLGNTPPSGTAWRQVNALLQESHSLFDLMTENKGLHLEQMLRRFVIPFLKKQMDTADEISATLEAHQITKIDSLYIPQEAIKRFNKQSAQQALDHIQNPDKTAPPQPYDPRQAQGQVQQELSQQGATRYFVPSDISDMTWKELFKDLEWELDIDITSEGNLDKENLVTLTTMLNTIASNPRVLFDPNAKLIFNKILMASGAVSPLELVEAQPFIIPPNKRLTETLDYVDAPEDIKRQMEEQAGFKPSTMGAPQQKPQVPASVGGGSGGLSVTK